ncbi:MAG: hypothetical protein HQ463_08935 [Bacteroidetes bacterium]|nr:hypothetical protein [Bacteroidota bacterium]
MNYPFLLKFSSITNLSDARYAVCAWADFVGFCFDASKPEYIEPNRAKEIAGWINGSLIVGEFGHQPIEWISDFTKNIPCHALQIPSNFENLNVLDLNLPIILEIHDTINEYLIKAAKCLLVFDKTQAEILAVQYNIPVILETTNLDELKTLHENTGIALKGEFEKVPGTRNHESWNALLEPYSN